MLGEQLGLDIRGGLCEEVVIRLLAIMDENTKWTETLGLLA